MNKLNNNLQKLILIYTFKNIEDNQDILSMYFQHLTFNLCDKHLIVNKSDYVEKIIIDINMKILTRWLVSECKFIKYVNLKVSHNLINGKIIIYSNKNYYFKIFIKNNKQYLIKFVNSKNKITIRNNTVNLITNNNIIINNLGERIDIINAYSYKNYTVFITEDSIKVYRTDNDEYGFLCDYSINMYNEIIQLINLNLFTEKFDVRFYKNSKRIKRIKNKYF